MQNEIDEWLEAYGNAHELSGDAATDAIRFIRQLRAESEGWQRQAGRNLQIAADELRKLAHRFYPEPKE